MTKEEFEELMKPQDIGESMSDNNILVFSNVDKLVIEKKKEDKPFRTVGSSIDSLILNTVSNGFVLDITYKDKTMETRIFKSDEREAMVQLLVRGLE